MSEPTSTVLPRTRRELTRNGLTPHVLAGPRYRRTSPGRYVPARVELTPWQRIVEAAAHMPAGSAIGGWASAYASGATMLDGRDGAGTLLPVPVHAPAPLHRRSILGTCYVREVVDPQDMIDRRGITFVGPIRTAADLARRASSLVEAVVALDTMLAAEVVDEADLVAATSRLHGRRGAKQARLALGLARPGVRSPGESRLRMIYLLEAGGAEGLLVNPTVADLDGRFVAIPDLLDEEAGLALEYDGAQWSGAERPAGHRDRAQHREDNVREEGLESLGLAVVRADGDDVSRFRRELVGRLVRARGRGLLRDRTRDGWRVLTSGRPVRFSAGRERSGLPLAEEGQG